MVAGIDRCVSECCRSCRATANRLAAVDGASAADGRAAADGDGGLDATGYRCITATQPTDAADRLYAAAGHDATCSGTLRHGGAWTY